MVKNDGTVKILDFGLAKLRDQPVDPHGLTSLTDPGTIMGTLGYMSPEQANGGIVDFRSDQFSFGAVLYEMLNEQRAFQGKGRTEIMAAILRDQPERLHVAKLQVPAPFFWILERWQRIRITVTPQPEIWLAISPQFAICEWIPEHAMPSPIRTICLYSARLSSDGSASW